MDMELGSKNQLIVQMPGEAAGAAPLPGSRRDPFVVLTTAELAECNCPEFCERDHDLD